MSLANIVNEKRAVNQNQRRNKNNKKRRWNNVTDESHRIERDIRLEECLRNGERKIADSCKANDTSRLLRNQECGNKQQTTCAPRYSLIPAIIIIVENRVVVVIIIIEVFITAYYSVWPIFASALCCPVTTTSPFVVDVNALRSCPSFHSLYET